MPNQPHAPRSSPAAALVVALLKLVWAALVIATPVLGVWVASSLAAYRGGPVAVALAAGLLLFPVVPVAWELWARHRKRRRGDTRPAILTTWDRLTLRTLAVNIVFLAALLGARPQLAFTALSTRGDWMLDGRADPGARAARAKLFAAANSLEWLYRATRDNPFRDRAAQRPAARPAPSDRGAVAREGSRPVQPDANARGDRAPEPPRDANAAVRWPMPATLHPVVAAMTRADEASIDAVGRLLAERVPDRAERLKAVHDWVADRIAYDGPSYRAGRYPPQDAETVFRTRVGVCAGYARLTEAIGRAAGLEVFYIVGDVRKRGGSVDGESHAWNAARVAGRWYLLDATWDSGYLEGETFRKRYRTDYLMAPADVFLVDHFPEDPAYQLRDAPMSRGDFMRQPMMSPGFYAAGYELVSPSRSQVTTRGELVVDLRNPRGRFVLADVVPKGAHATGARCEVTNGPSVRVRCPLASPGTFDVRLFDGPAEFGQFDYIGAVEAVNSL